jgi:hypothetical protein
VSVYQAAGVMRLAIQVEAQLRTEDWTSSRGREEKTEEKWREAMEIESFHVQVAVQRMNTLPTETSRLLRLFRRDCRSQGGCGQ